MFTTWNVLGLCKHFKEPGLSGWWGRAWSAASRGIDVQCTMVWTQITRGTHAWWTCLCGSAPEPWTWYTGVKSEASWCERRPLSCECGTTGPTFPCRPAPLIQHSQLWASSHPPAKSSTGTLIILNTSWRGVKSAGWQLCVHARPAVYSGTCMPGQQCIQVPVCQASSVFRPVPVCQASSVFRYLYARPVRSVCRYLYLWQASSVFRYL